MTLSRLVTFTLATLLAVLLLNSCATFPEPDAAHTTLVVGSIELTATGHPIYSSGATVNGTHKDGIEITIENMQTKAKYVLRGGEVGLFFSREVPAGDYSIKRFYYKRTFGNTWADTNTYPGGDRFFAIIEGKVNNLGAIAWQSDIEEGIKYRIDKDYATVQDQISNTYTESQWLKRDWQDVNVHK